MFFISPVLLIIDPISMALVASGIISSAMTAIVSTIGEFTVKKLLKKDKIEITVTRKDGTDIRLSFEKDVSDDEIEKAIRNALQKEPIA